VHLKCIDYGATCGTPSDGCGGVLSSCGTCDGGICSNFACCTPGPQWGPVKSTTAVADFSTTGIGTRAWTNASNAKQIDDTTADVTGMAAGDISHYLYAEGFGLSVPSNATILGIEVHIRRKSLTGGIVDQSVVLFESGSYAGANHSSNTTWGTTFTTAVYGGTGDLWGSAWTPAALNNVQFGVGLAVQATAANDAPNVDMIEVQVEYSVPCP
jgi:hypothetical protein